MVEIRSGVADWRAAGRALGVAFRDDPVVRWMHPSGRRTELLLTTLARFSHGRHGGTDLAVVDGAVVGAALWDRPGYRPSAGQELASVPAFVRALRGRSHYGAALERSFHRQRPAGAFWYLAQLGATRPGEGIGSALLRHGLDRVDGPTYLESSNIRNVPLYERFGFRVVGEIRLPFDGPTCWRMYRS